MARHDDFDDFFSDDEASLTDTRADGRLYRVPVTRLAPNRVNPRQDFGTEDQLIDFGKSLARRQNQPCPVVSRSAYLKLWPEHGDDIGDVDYVLVSGERRFRAAKAVELPVLDCVANDDFAADRKTFMEAVVSENVDRQNFDAIEEAYAVQALVTEFGTNRAVAQHFERADGWVTQRILLTHLAREIQDLVRAKSLPLDAARSLGKLARDKEWGARDQMAWWEEEQERRAAASAARSAARKAAKRQPAPAPSVPTPAAASPVPASFPAVKLDPAPTPHAGEPSAKPAGEPRAAVVDRQPEPAPSQPARTEVETPSAPAADSIPEPRTSPRQPSPPESEQPPRTLPYDDGPFVALHLIRKMPQGAFDAMLDVLIEHREKQTANT